MPERGQTPNELARILRVSADTVRAWIASGALGAVNTAKTLSGRPRYVVLPHHLAEWENRHKAAQPAPTAKRRPQKAIKDYYA